MISSELVVTIMGGATVLTLMVPVIALCLRMKAQQIKN